MKRPAVFTFLCLALAASMAALSAGADPTGASEGQEVATVEAVEPAAVASAAACSAGLPSFAIVPSPVAFNGGGTRAYCEATCHDGSVISCNTSGTCDSQDAVCPINRGYVQCGSKKIYCPACNVNWCPAGPCNYVFDEASQCCLSASCGTYCP